MEASVVAAKLQALADEMRLASVTLRAHADQLKETSRSLGAEAAALMRTVLDGIKIRTIGTRWADYPASSCDHAASGNICHVLPAVRKLLRRQVDPANDGVAFKYLRRLPEIGDPKTFEAQIVDEAELTEPERERFYYKQARDWATLIDLCASCVREKTDREKFMEAYVRVSSSEPKLTQDEALIKAAAVAGLDYVPSRQRLPEWSKETGIEYKTRKPGRLNRTEPQRPLEIVRDPRTARNFEDFSE